MNKNSLKSFARAARRKLMEQVTSKLDYLLTTDSAELRNKRNQINELKKKISETSREDVIEKVAYTWFNRFAALRFMDANGYTPIKVVSPATGFTTPELLVEAKKGHIDEKLRVDRTKINDLLDGRIPARDPQNEVYQMLLVATCNYYHGIMPFLFEPINDYTELLIPDDLISQNSIVNDIVTNMTEQDCQDVEIIGWLYQYYISEKKDEVISAKRRYTPREIPAATQLFTPKWIVKYMVENTLGQMWLEARPHSKIKQAMEFYIEPTDKDKIPPRHITSPEELKLCDPCAGSGHILVYSFDLLTKIYEEEGYDPGEIPHLILTKNLYGIEIDDRAASLAGFALFMKARRYDKNFFRNPVQPKVLTLQNIRFSEDELDRYINEMGANLFTANLKQALLQFEDAKNIGSLIRPDVASVSDITGELATKDLGSNLFLAKTHQKVVQALKQIAYLQEQYDCVITNPPYVNSKYMNESLSDFIKQKYPETKSDLFASFLVRCRELSKTNGMIGFVSPYVWMFIKSYEWLRKYLIENTTINNLIQLEYNAFEPACVPVCTFTLRNKSLDIQSEFIKLTDFTGHENQPIKTLEAIQNPETDYRYTANQKDFQKIPGAPIAYWVSERVIKIFEENKALSEFAEPKQGLITGDNERYIRRWSEVSFKSIGFNFKNRKDAKASNLKWFPYNKGGEFRKWYGNLELIVNWQKDGIEIINNKNRLGKLLSRPQNMKYYFREGITWSSLTSSIFNARYSLMGFLFDAKGPVLFNKNQDDIIYSLALVNSKPANSFLSILAPTLDFNQGPIGNLPYIDSKEMILTIEELTNDCLYISKEDWDSREISWDFQKSELIVLKKNESIAAAFTEYCNKWKEKFLKLHAKEEGLNKIFIEIYGLQDELTPEVDLKDMTILKDEITILDDSINEKDILKGKSWEEINDYLKSDERRQRLEKRIVFRKDEIMRQFISYAVGCMFGRYSLDKEGLILANQGETVEDYKRILATNGHESTRIEKHESGGSIRDNSSEFVAPSFEPDKDNIIPILEDEYFTDDIVGRFKKFLKVSFGEEHYEENLQFMEDALGTDIRSYFLRDFYKDHIKRYKKRPIYWLFSSPNRGFNALIYMHRYRPDTVSTLLNDYVREFITKLESRRFQYKEISLSESSSKRDRKLADREIARIDKLLKELRNYEEKILRPLASQRIEIDLDDGVKVNYCKFGRALYPIPGLCKKN